MRIHRSSPAARTVAVLAGASLFVTACGAGGGGGNGGAGGGGGESAAEVEGDSTGVTDTTIKIGTHKPLTGVAAPGYSEIPAGAQAYFDHVNAAGGVCGRQIEYVVRDDAYNPTQTAQVTNQLVLQDEIFAMMGGLGTPTHSAVLDFLNENQVPDLFVASGALAWNDPETYPYTFGWQPDYRIEGKVLGQYIAENFPDAQVGLFGQGDDFGRDGFAGARQYLEDQIVAEETYTPGNTDVGPQISALQQAGADLVISFSVPAYTALSQLTSLRLNYSPQWAYSNVGSDATLVGALLNNFSQGAVSDGEGLLEGAFTTAYIPTVEQTDNPWTQTFQGIWDEQGGDGDLSNFKVYGMSQAYTMISALTRICDNLNREALVAVLQEQGSEFEGPWLAPLDYSDTSHRGISGVQVVQLEGGTPVERTDIFTVGAEEGAEPEAYTEDPDEPTDDGIPSAG
ncbi:MAG TPA: ABC transporter substrate-binding protein [Mycobacteriales bacterium]|nr:ABC transporter substrate-binding protein [Mycobacteriales bacterium]